MRARPDSPAAGGHHRDRDIHSVSGLAPRDPARSQRPGHLRGPHPGEVRANRAPLAGLITAMQWKGLLKAPYDLSVKGNLEKQINSR